MKILLIGATGTIGKRISAELSKKHEVISGSRSGSDVEVDITSAISIEDMYHAAGKLGAVICAAGPAKFGPFGDMSEDDMYVGIHGKMMGQVNLVRIGQNYLNDGGSFTLTTGILADEPVVGSVGLALVNGAVNSFALAAAQELPRGQRINVVCPTVVEDSAEMYADFFPGYDPVSMERVVNGYVKSVEGKMTGKIIRVY